MRGNMSLLSRTWYRQRKSSNSHDDILATAHRSSRRGYRSLLKSSSSTAPSYRSSFPTSPMFTTPVPPQAILCVVGGFIIHICLGVLYTWSVVTAAVTSYLRQYEPDITYNDTILIYSISLFIQSGSMVLGGLLSDSSVLGVKKCCALGSFFLILSMLLVGMGVCCCSSGNSRNIFDSGLTKMIIFHSFPFGLGIGLTYTPPIAASVKWLPQWKGLLTGIIMCGLGIGAMLFGFMCTAVLNPHHQNVETHGPDKGYFPSNSSVVQNVPTMYLTVTLCFTILLPLGCCLVNEPPISTAKPSMTALPTSSEHDGGIELTDTENPMYSQKHIESESKIMSSGGEYDNVDDRMEPINGDEEEVVEIDFSQGDSMHHRVIGDGSSHTTSRQSMGESRHALIHDEEDIVERSDSLIGADQSEHLSMKEIALTSLAWHVILCYFCTTGGGMFLLGSFKTLAQQQIHNEAFLATIGSLSTLANSSGRIIWGIISDSSVGTLNTLMIAIFGFVIVLFTFPSAVTIGGEAGFAVWALMIFFFEASNFAIYFPITVMLFGTKHAASNYGFIVTCYSSFFMLMSYLIAKGKFEMRGVCYIIGSITFCGFLSLSLLRWRIRDRKKLG